MAKLFVCHCLFSLSSACSLSLFCLLSLLSLFCLLSLLSLFCLLSQRTTLQKAKLMFVPDVRAILSDFELMGEGLVSSVEVLAEPPPTEHQ